MKPSRPRIDPKQFDLALERSELSEEEIAMIEFIRYMGVFNELSLRHGLSLPSKPPAVYSLNKLCKKMSLILPDLYQQMMTWSIEQSPDKIAWDANLVCSIAYSCDGERLEPESGTTLYHTFTVHKELFNGLGE